MLGIVHQYLRGKPGMGKKILKSTTAALLSAFCLTAAETEAAEVFTEHGTRISFDRSDNNFFQIRDRLRNIEQTVAKRLRKDNNSKIVRCEISFHDSSSIQTNARGDNLEIRLPRDLRAWSDDTHRQLLAAFYLTRSGIIPASDAELRRVPLWLLTASALQSTADSNTPEPLGYRHFPALRAVELQGHEIGLDTILASSPEPGDGPVFEVYAEAARILLAVCDSTGGRRDALYRGMIQLAHRNIHTPADAFFLSTGKILIRKISRATLEKDNSSDRVKITRWFREHLRSRLINNFNPLPARMIRERFEQLANVTCKLKDGNESSINIEMLGEQWNNISNRKACVNAISSQIDKLQQEVSAGLIPLLAAIHAAVSSLPDSQEKDLPPDIWNSDMAERHGIEIRRLSGQLSAAIAQFAAIEDYLESFGDSHLAPPVNFRHRLKALESMRQTGENIWPDVNNYLDKLEKEYFRR